MSIIVLCEAHPMVIVVFKILSRRACSIFSPTSWKVKIKQCYNLSFSSECVFANCPSYNLDYHNNQTPLHDLSSWSRLKTIFLWKKNIRKKLEIIKNHKNQNNSALPEWLEAEKLKRRWKQKTYPCLYNRGEGTATKRQAKQFHKTNKVFPRSDVVLPPHLRQNQTQTNPFPRLDEEKDTDTEDEKE